MAPKQEVAMRQGGTSGDGMLAVLQLLDFPSPGRGHQWPCPDHAGP